MLDFDLAEMYGVETRVLNKLYGATSNVSIEFMFELTKEEAEFSRSQSVTLKTGQDITLNIFLCFTEYGVVMLSSVLKQNGH